MAKPTKDGEIADLFIIGGGVNGCGIARDAAGRGMKVVLAEQDDLAQATSSASTKLFHGGLRYLEHYEFRLVREALIERELLWQAMPHISWPLRFVLPYHKRLRPTWLMRLGLFIYDHLGGRKLLPATKTLDLRSHPTSKPLKSSFTKGYEYSDCWVQDARLVALNARDAANRSATILTRSRVTRVQRHVDHWIVTITDTNTAKTRDIRVRCLVNAGGPWVADVILDKLHITSREKTRLVRGSHIVTKRLFDHDQPYILQGADNRVVFAIPYEDDFTLIGTTDDDHKGPPGEAECTDQEADYLCNFVSEYFKKPVTRDDIVWTYSGIRPLYDDGASSVTEATRVYVLSLDTQGGAPLLNIFGGKSTTYRRLAEAALKNLAQVSPVTGANWTAGVALPGGDFPADGVLALVDALQEQFPFLDFVWARRLVRCFGTEARDVLAGARTIADLGRDFGAGLSEAELHWLMAKKFARTGDDVLWRRTKLGLRMDAAQRRAVSDWMKTQATKREAAA